MDWASDGMYVSDGRCMDVGQPVGREDARSAAAAEYSDWRLPALITGSSVTATAARLDWNRL